MQSLQSTGHSTTARMWQPTPASMETTILSSESFGFFFKHSGSSSNITRHLIGEFRSLEREDVERDIARVDTGDDDRISKEEFTSDALKGAMEKVTNKAVNVRFTILCTKYN